MLCERCKQRNATTHYTQNINGTQTEMHICEKCAAELSGQFENEYGKFFNNFGLGLDYMLTSLLGQDFIGENLLASKEERCPMCQSTLSSIRKSGNVGCSKCYETFKEQLMPFIQRIHGKTSHNGKIPESANSSINIKNQIAEAEKEMKSAIEAQEFEKAAELRDKINSLKSEL